MQIKRFICEWKSKRMNEWMNTRTKKRTNNKVGVSHSEFPIIRPRPPNVHSKYITACFFLLLVVLRIYAALVIFHPYRDLEAGDNHSGIVAARPGIEPRPLAPQAKSLNTTPPLLLFFRDSRKSLFGQLGNRYCWAKTRTRGIGW